MIDIENLYESSLSLARNEYLKVQGSVDTNAYFVESGSLQIFLLDDGEEQIIRFGYQNDLIVSMDSFLREKPSAFYIQAIKKSVVKVIPRKKIFDFIYANEDNQRLYIEILENLALDQLEREKDLLISSPRERYLRVLNRSPKLFQEIPNRHIANYLRMSPETLSRLKKS